MAPSVLFKRSNDSSNSLLSPPHVEPHSTVSTQQSIAAHYSSPTTSPTDSAQSLNAETRPQPAWGRSAMSPAPANSANFWAQKRKQVTGPPVVQQDSEPVLPTPAKKDGTAKVCKPKANGDNFEVKPNGLAKPSPFSWADDEDDGTFDPTIGSDDKAERIAALESSVTEKVERIRELEGVVEDKAHRIDDLESVVEGKTKRIAEVEKDNHSKFLYLQELVAEVDDKNRRNQQLEAELDQKGARIRELELALKATAPPHPPQTSQVEAVAQSADDTKHELTVSEMVADNLPAPPTPPDSVRQDSIAVVSVNATSDATPSPVALSKASELTPVTSPKTSPPPTLASAPEVRNVAGPVFVTPETIKQMPKVPPAPKLTLGIDMSKYGKKPAQQKPAAMATTKPPSNRTRKPDIVPVINPGLDVRKMSRAEREPFGSGPKVSILIGTALVGTVHKYMLMQCSEKANEYFTENPTAANIVFPAGSMDAEAVEAHINWMEMHTWCGKVFSIHLNDSNTDTRNLNITRAARVMGLNNTYVGHFTKQYCDIIRQRMPSHELIALIEELAYPENDPIFDCLANNIAIQRQRGNLPDPEEFGKFLTKCPHISAAIDKIETRMNRQGWREKQVTSDMNTDRPKGGKNGKRGSGKGGSAGLAPVVW